VLISQRVWLSDSDPLSGARARLGQIDVELGWLGAMAPLSVGWILDSGDRLIGVSL
jgi:hypothetical protein